MLSPETEDDEFEFYLKIAKPLVLNLPETIDRIKAATWIRYLTNDTSDSALRGQYLKLLLFVLQRRKLFGPFTSIPDENIPLQKFSEDINIQEVVKNVVEVDKQILKANLERQGFEEWPPCSSDLKEYAAKQDIPRVQAYYAHSKDPLQFWDHCENEKCSLGESTETANPDGGIMDMTSPDIGCFVSPDQNLPGSSGSPRAAHRKLPNDNTPPKRLEDVGPKIQKKLCPAEENNELNTEIRVPWGSTLKHVQDSPNSSYRSSPSNSVPDFDMELSLQDVIDLINDDGDLY